MGQSPAWTCLGVQSGGLEETKRPGRRLHLDVADGEQPCCAALEALHSSPDDPGADDREQTGVEEDLDVVGHAAPRSSDRSGESLDAGRAIEQQLQQGLTQRVEDGSALSRFGDDAEVFKWVIRELLTGRQMFDQFR